tara:strand:- start:88 stop:609 length:522 start_codon:yes stop_codon:yes gene_type:complete
MKNDKITFEPRFSFHQRTVLTGFFIISLIGTFNSIPTQSNIFEYLGLMFFVLLSLILLILVFSKKGLQKTGEKLYRTISFREIIIFKTRIELSDRPIVSLLKFRKTQKFAFVSSANPDQGESFNVFEIFVLNERHTKRDSVIYFKHKESANTAIEFMTKDFALKHEIFSPNFD